MNTYTKTRYALMMQTDRGPRFLKQDGYSLTLNPMEAGDFGDIVASTAKAHSIGDTDYHIEVVKVEYSAKYETPPFYQRRAA